MQMTHIPFDIVGFDLDGTLLDTSGDLAAAVNHAIGTIDQPPIAVSEIKRFVGRGARIMLERALQSRDIYTPDLLEQLLPHLLDYYGDNLVALTVPYPGCIAALDTLKAAGVRLAVCTNKAERFTLPLLERIGMKHYFESIIGGDTVGVSKPDPKPILAMVERAGGGPAIFVGDTINDIAGARNAGLPSIAVTFGFVEAPAHELGADAVLNHFDELVPLLKGWRAS